MPVKWPWPSMKPGMAIWPFEIDHLCAGSNVAADLGVGSERHDRVAIDGNRLRRRAGVISGDHAAVVEHQCRRRNLRRLCPRAGTHGDECGARKQNRQYVARPGSQGRDET